MQADPPPEQSASANLIRDLERQRLRSLVEPNLDLARALHADDYELIPPGGAALGGTDYLGAIERGDMVYEVFEAASEIAVRTYRDAAVVRYRARIEVHGDDWRDGGLFWHTDLYEKRDGRWQAVWSQATRTRPAAGA
jgi:hypothetical protein